jgi:hypothetical protein
MWRNRPEPMRSALRLLRQSPGFIMNAARIPTPGIGTNRAVMKAVLMQALPVRRAVRLGCAH